MNENLEIPEDIQKKLKSKPKLTKLSFIDKINLLLDWAKDDDQKLYYIGITPLEDGDLSVNLPVLAHHFMIQERSLVKNFQLCNYQRCKKQPYEGRVCFTNKTDSNSLIYTFQKINQIVGNDKIQNWDTNMISYWEKFERKYREKNVCDFITHNQFGITRGMLPLSCLISYLIQSNQIDASMFQFLYLHFSPMSSLPGKISSLLSSAFSRGWVVGEGPHTVKIVEPYGFLFDDGNQQIMMYNNLRCSYPGLWLVNFDTTQHYEVEDFFETFYPREIPSNRNFIDIISKYFPEALENANEDLEDNDVDAYFDNDDP